MPDSPMDVKTQCRVTSPTLLSPPTTQGASTGTSLTPPSYHNSAGDPSCASNGIPSPSNGCAARPSSSSSSSSSSTSSSPSASSPSVTPQLPPACGARQLSKLKRFLATLQQFASDISPEIGEQVHALVLGLLNSTLTIEQFHSRLQEATNFPLRPTVVPFLKANVPLLQCELIHCARLAKQNPTQYLAQHEQLLLSTRTSSPVDSAELLWDVNKNPKRKPAGRTKDNDADQEPLHLYPPSKKQCTISPYRQNGLSHMPLPLAQSLCADGTALAHHRSDSHRPPSRREHREQNKANRTHNARREETVDHRLTDKEWADEWKHLDHLLNCIRDMVEKTRHSLTVLRRCQEADREELGYWARRCSDAEDVKKGSSTSQSKVQSPGGQNPGLAEDAVNEVKKQAMAELQSAVSEAERRAQEMIRSERAKMEQAVAEARRRAAEDLLLAVNQQEDSTESCWNCGRRASETCSGCSTARYCGSFCQHKDWERHHHVCSRTPPAHQHDDRSPSACSSSLHTSDTGGPADTPPANTPPEVTPHSTPPLTAGAAVQ